MMGSAVFAIVAEGPGPRYEIRDARTPSPVPPPPQPPPRPPKLLDRIRAAIRARHYSPRTEETYIAWIRQFILRNGKRHPRDMGEPEVTAFLTNLAVDRKVGASTQNQALAALLFLYREALGVDLPWLDGVVKAKRPERVPVVPRDAGVRGRRDRRVPPPPPPRDRHPARRPEPDRCPLNRQ